MCAAPSARRLTARKGSKPLEPILKIENLTHTYSAGTPFERRAVDGVNLEVAPGEFLGVIGHTGSGKSTFIQHLNGLLRPTEGRILLEGRDIWAEPKKIRRVRFEVGLVFQYPEYQLFEETVYKDIAFGPGNMGLSKDEIDRRVREAAELVGLSEDMLAQSPFELSGGQKRRVAIAGVIAMEPKVLILDEPTAGLDPRGRDGRARADPRLSRAPRARLSSSSATAWRRSPATPGASSCSAIRIFSCRARPREVFARAEELEQRGAGRAAGDEDRRRAAQPRPADRPGGLYH